MRVEALVNLEEISVWFSAKPEMTDYGVPRSPTWVEYEDIRVESVEILGVEVKPSSLPVELQEALLELSSEVDAWEGEE